MFYNDYLFIIIKPFTHFYTRTHLLKALLYCSDNQLSVLNIAFLFSLRLDPDMSQSALVFSLCNLVLIVIEAESQINC